MKNSNKVGFGKTMRNLLLTCTLIAVGLTACANKESASETALKEVKAIKNPNISMQFQYNSTGSSVVSVTEFENEFDEVCVVVHANYNFRDSKASIDCIGKWHEKKFDNDNDHQTKIVKQFEYHDGKTPVQVTMTRTSKGHTCTIVHADYMHATSTASVHCS